MYVIICGGGGLGRELAKSLIEKHEDIVVIEQAAAIAKKLANELDALVINGTAINPKKIETEYGATLSFVVSKSGKGAKY